MRKMSYVAPLVAGVAAALLYADYAWPQSAFRARDPGPRGGAPAAGGPITGLTASELAFFNASKAAFQEVEDVSDGLGPTMNLDSCAGCHAQPSAGGSSPAVNPQVAFATKNGAKNTVPSFIKVNGPVREARFVKNPDGSADGGVHSLFTVAGRADIGAACQLRQENFAAALSANNVIFRVPTPVFGAGLIESIPDATIIANASANLASKQPLGIGGRPNIQVPGRTVSGETNNSGNDGTVTRFGWKAQNKSLLIFSGEAYNVEMGISNELFPTERDATATCQTATVPNDFTHTDAAAAADASADTTLFALFQRLLAPPTPSADMPGGTASIGNGKQIFASTGCALCHTPTLRTGNAAVAALRYQNANLYSDLLVHDMGPNLADGVSQGSASGSEFRTAPLWGLGQRLFFLHDGRSSDLVDAINQHASGSQRQGNASEANGVVSGFNNLTERQKQDLLNFLRSL
ncbi:MAG TPA: di-heme oxidoredictase family protein [Usitatibacter sp.]|nr:di-heme oxidoredictase family protein [Usitatibacter sp.]